MAELDFIHTDEPQIHPGRRKEILAKYPQVRELTGPSRGSFPAVLLMVVAQLGIAWFVRDQPWWVVLLSGEVPDRAAIR